GLTFYYRMAGQDREAVEAVSVPPVEAPPAGEPATSSTVMEETPPSPVIRPPELVLPPLNASDDFVRGRLPDTIPQAWTGKDDLLRRLAVLAENASRGELPRRQLAFLAPDGKFAVREQADTGSEEAKLFMDPAGYRRYDRYLDILESLPPATLAALLNDTAPLLQQAVQELGVEGEAQAQMLAAIDQMMAVPVLEGDVELVQPKVFYEYADPSLEALSSLQKQVLRMGPENVKRLQAYLTTLRAELERR
ncbi:MAG: DUF3014 domain-containing protein, partial [Pseudomonadales bacterium]